MAGPASTTPEQTTARTTTVAVVGAGMAGLIAARDLHRRGVDVLVLESAGRPGGRMLAETTPLGSRVDLGGQWVGHGHHRFTALAAELGVTVFKMHTPKRPTVVDGSSTIAPISATMLMAGAVMAGWEIASRIGTPRHWHDISVRRWLDRVPVRRARRLLEVLVTVSTTADLDRLPMRAFCEIVRSEGGLATMLATANGAQDALIVEGAGTLTERLADDLGPRLALNSAVTAIDRDETGVTLHLASGTVRAQKVIVTVPPPVAARIEHRPALPRARTHLQKATYMGSVYKAIAVYDRPFWRGATDAELLVLGLPGSAVFDTSPPDGPGCLCILVAGPEARDLDRLGEGGRRAALLAPLSAHIGPQVMAPASWHEKSWHRDEHVGGGYGALPDMSCSAGCFPYSAEPVGHVHWAGTETAGEHAGYIEGAIESGQRVAREVAALLAATAHHAHRPPTDEAYGPARGARRCGAP